MFVAYLRSQMVQEYGVDFITKNQAKDEIPLGLPQGLSNRQSQHLPYVRQQDMKEGVPQDINTASSASFLNFSSYE